MTGLQISRVDVYDDAALSGWWQTRSGGLAHDLGRHATFWQLAELRVFMRTHRLEVETELYAAVLDGQVVAAAQLDLPQLDNRTLADIDVVVHPDHRRQGHGSALLAHVEAAARSHGRTGFTAICTWPYAEPADGAGNPGMAFARRHDYATSLGDVQRELVLPVDDALLTELAAEAADHADDYEVRAWIAPCPDDLLKSFIGLSSRLVTEAPMGSMEWEQRTTDLDAARNQVEVQTAAGRTVFQSAAITPDGEVVAYSELALAAYDPSWAIQWGTLVDPAHRGHRLGLAVKVAALQLMQRDPRVTGRRIVTWNAAENDHVIGINQRLGFEPVCGGAELLKKV